MNLKEKMQKLLYGGDVDGDVDDVVTDGEDDYDTVSDEQPAARHTVSAPSAAGSIEMKVVKPDSLDSVSQIADHLLDRRTILLNLEDTNRETARRLVDFLQGVAYAINGTLKKVANCTYVITPSNVDVSGEQIKETQESGDIV